MLREELLIKTFLELADTLVDDFDVFDLLTRLTGRCVEVLDIAAAGIMIAGPDGGLRVVASSSEAMRLLELFELQTDEGPCPECFVSGVPVVNERLARDDDRWPRFAPLAVAAGFESAHAVPMRLRGQTIGALNLFRSDEGLLNDVDVVAAQALADVATISVLSHRAATETEVVNGQLTAALSSRVKLEQAKGMVAERTGVTMEEAFDKLRSYARNNNRVLVDVAGSVVDGSVTPAALDAKT